MRPRVHSLSQLGASVLLLVGCTAPSRAEDSRAYGEPQRLAEVSDERLVEVSGIAASRRHAEMYYVHNDSGGEPRVFVLDRHGAVRAVIVLEGARNVDWEDIAIAPGDTDGAFAVCVADIGDNRRRRDQITFYRFPEPDLPGRPQAEVRLRPRTFRARYPDEPHNAEGFAVHPQTGDAYVLTKQDDGSAGVYRMPAPWKADEVIVLERVTRLRTGPGVPLATIVTAADISPDGRRLATRSYLTAWEWTLPETTQRRGFSQIFTQAPERIELAAEPQGEALAYSATGDALLSISEGNPTVLYEVRRRNRPAARGP
jgi:hypothetical protein